MVEVQVSPQGRVVIPVELRKAWQIEAGDILLARLENDRLILEKPAQIVRRIKARFAFLQNQPSLADELIAERRVTAALETKE